MRGGKDQREEKLLETEVFLEEHLHRAEAVLTEITAPSGAVLISRACQDCQLLPS